MNEYRVSFYTQHNPGMQFDIIKAETRQEVFDIFQATGCEVISVEELNPCICFEYMGDNKDCPKHGKMFDHGRVFKNYDYEYPFDFNADYRERNDLHTMGMGG